ncbi:MAG: YtxH domain-containing protein [Saprospiraceae bacterium]|jgi:gas vesicle protein|nr:YtxH domain-containing protein [Saprospiraceae bacterium]MBP6569156.1 YtxH domain-containing protein [Saprospiraceae bacterium]
MSVKNVLLGVLAGAATGAAIGVLFAPDKGKSTRKKIMEKGDNYLSDFELTLNGYLDMINRKMENMKLEITHMSTNGKAKMEDALTDVINTKTK